MIEFHRGLRGKRRGGGANAVESAASEHLLGSVTSSICRFAPDRELGDAHFDPEPLNRRPSQRRVIDLHRDFRGERRSRGANASQSAAN